MNPNQRQQVTVINCSIAFIETNASTKYYTSTTKYTSYSKRPNVIAIAMDVIGSMLSVPVKALRMPRFLANTAIYVSKLGQKLARSEWHNYTVLDN